MRIKYLIIIATITLTVVTYQDFYYQHNICEGHTECIENTLNGLQDINYGSLSGSITPIVDHSFSSERYTENDQYIVSSSYCGTSFLK